MTVSIQDWLLPSASPSQLLQQIAASKADSLALVGHLPNLGLVLGSLVWGLPAKEVVITRGGVACLTTDAWEIGAARLRWLMTPESIG